MLASDCVDSVRARKDEKEQELMRMNSRLNDEAMRRAAAYIREGMTERQVADYLRAQYQDLGCEAQSFPPIVSFGANAADPHHMPDDTVLRAGDCIVLDIGGRKEGYCSDMTRTYFCKQVSEKHAGHPRHCAPGQRGRRGPGPPRGAPCASWTRPPGT